MHHLRTLAATMATVALLLATPPPIAAQATIASSRLVAQVPSAPSGWKGPRTQDLQGEAAGIQVSQVTATYAGSGGATATLVVVASPAMVAASRAAGMTFRNQSMIDMMNKNNPAKHYERIDEAAFSGWMLVDREKGMSEFTAFDELILVKLEIDRADGDSLQAFRDSIDWNALGSLAAEK